jgi:hypothetical protein|tara:strand:- start:6560 stop:6745 length:186 start_codon:yes stop_codon:yes gene_type:complete
MKPELPWLKCKYCGADTGNTYVGVGDVCVKHIPRAQEDYAKLKWKKKDVKKENNESAGNSP